MSPHVRFPAYPCHCRLPACGLREGRARAWPADGVDGPACGVDAAGPGARHCHRASDRHQYLADLRYTTIALGLLLAINAIIGLTKFNFIVAPRNEKWVGGIVGLITGMISAATGVQVVPSVPFLQAIGMEKEELIQALGVFFTVATLALGLNLTGAGLLTAATALPGAVAMVASFAGMFIGQAVRTRLQPDIFRRWFQIGMIVLGLYLASNALAKLMS
jgi:uncharacterized membrane protein YfcA